MVDTDLHWCDTLNHCGCKGSRFARFKPDTLKVWTFSGVVDLTGKDLLYNQ